MQNKIVLCPHDSSRRTECSDTSKCAECTKMSSPIFRRKYFKDSFATYSDECPTPKIIQLLNSPMWRYINARMDCRECMLGLDKHRPLVRDAEEDKRYMEIMPKLGMAETAYLQTFEEFHDCLKEALESICSEAGEIKKQINAYREYADRIYPHDEEGA